MKLNINDEFGCKSIINPLKQKQLVLLGGLQAFQEFLRSEYSEENLKFWLACEAYRGAPSKTKANSICSQFITADAPQEVGAEAEKEKKAWQQ